MGEKQLSSDSPSPDENDFWSEFGLPLPEFETDLSSMPPIDKEARARVLALIRNELPGKEALCVASLLRRFKPWNDLCTELSRAELAQLKKK